MTIALKTSLPVDILLVEDNLGDVELTQDAFHVATLASRVHVARNGDEALEFLYQRGEFTQAPRPDLILLDLNMPGKNGREVLSVIKADDALKDIPVIILTSSEAEKDIARSYELHANAYIVKPLDFPQLLHAVQALELFWFGVARLPSRQKKKA